jgi:zona occludens toxin
MRTAPAALPWSMTVRPLGSTWCWTTPEGSDGRWPVAVAPTMKPVRHRTGWHLVGLLPITGAMIAVVTGPPGAGKTFYALRKIAEAADAGKPVATNVGLAENFPEKVAGRNLARHLVRGRRAVIADRIRRNVMVGSDLDELFRLRLPGREEGRGLMVLDEASDWLNARRWQEGNRDAVVQFFTRHRKLGWDVLLLIQDFATIDRQVRSLFEYHVQLRNLRKARLLPWLPIPASPVPLFLAVWKWHGADVVMRREVFPLSSVRRLYDTNQLPSELADEADTIPFPLPAGYELGSSARRTSRAPAADVLRAEAKPEGDVHGAGNAAAARGPRGLRPPLRPPLKAPLQLDRACNTRSTVKNDGGTSPASPARLNGETPQERPL